MSSVSYPLDSTGLSPANLVSGEIHALTEINAATYRIIIPTFAPFYVDNFVLSHIDAAGVVTPLMPDVDYYLCLPYVGATRSIGKQLYGGVCINTDLIDGDLSIDYQVLGGDWVADPNIVRETLASLIYNPRGTIWDIITNKPNAFPPINHSLDIQNVYGMQDVINAINALSAAVANGPDTGSGVIKHFVNIDNPHEVTKEQVGLGSVSNLPLASDFEVASAMLVDKYVTLKQLVKTPITAPVDLTPIESQITTLNNIITAQANALSALSQQLATVNSELNTINSAIANGTIGTGKTNIFTAAQYFLMRN